jgi:hypothetical protein
MNKKGQDGKDRLTQKDVLKYNKLVNEIISCQGVKQ